MSTSQVVTEAQVNTVVQENTEASKETWFSKLFSYLSEKVPGGNLGLTIILGVIGLCILCLILSLFKGKSENDDMSGGNLMSRFDTELASLSE